MSATIVWIDTQHAKIFELEGPQVEIHALHRHEPEHHTSHSVDAAHDATHFYHQVASRIGDASQLLIVGPGVARDQFRHHLQLHHHEGLASKVVGVEASDHPTDAQLVAYARKYFEPHHVHSPRLPA
jgi:stalled ribosome rescue protein Dom34